MICREWSFEPRQHLNLIDHELFLLWQVQMIRSKMLVEIMIFVQSRKEKIFQVYILLINRICWGQRTSTLWRLLFWSQFWHMAQYFPSEEGLWTWWMSLLYRTFFSFLLCERWETHLGAYFCRFCWRFIIQINQ